VAVDLINPSSIQCFARIEHVAHDQAHPLCSLANRPSMARGSAPPLEPS
jgi:hypothetical protein